MENVLEATSCLCSPLIEMDLKAAFLVGQLLGVQSLKAGQKVLRLKERVTWLQLAEHSRQIEAAEGPVLEALAVHLAAPAYYNLLNPIAELLID